MILSVCIPTYNRVAFLKELVSFIINEINELALNNDIELLISNNCSTDGTQAYLDELKNNHPEINLLINNNEVNIGVLKNIVKCASSSNGKYWWFIGDDDKIPKGALLKIVNELRSNDESAVFIFNQKGSHNILNNESISIQECAEKHFYYIGNAVAICNTALSKKNINQYYNEILSTCWPQTHIYFLCMFDSNNKLPVRTSTIEAFQYYTSNNINSAYYHFDAQFYALFRLGYMLAEQTNNADFYNWFPKGVLYINKAKIRSWVFHINLVYRYYDFENEKKEFDETYAEAELKLLPMHQKHLNHFKQYKRIPNAYFKWVTIISKSTLQIAYQLIKKKKKVNPFSLILKEIKTFNQIKEDKMEKLKIKHLHLAGKNNW